MVTVDQEALLDETGHRILEELQRDGRVTLAELGRRVVLSPPAVADRLRRLEGAGIIEGYTAVVEPSAVGFGLFAFVRISLPTNVGNATLTSWVQEEERVLECHHITGEDCFLLKVVARDARDLESVVETLSTYGRTTTSIVLSSPLERRSVVPADSVGIPSTDGRRPADGQRRGRRRSGRGPKSRVST